MLFAQLLAEVLHVQTEISVCILASLGGQTGNVREGVRHAAGGGL